MIPKDMFDPAVKQEIIDRINQLTPGTQRRWGKMNVAQMLSHCQLQIKAAYGTHRVKGNFILNLVGPMFKSFLYNNRPYKKGMPTDPTYVVTDEKDFEKEKAQLLDLISQFSENNISEKPHPVFGRLTKEQWSKATWKHLDHHLQQFAV